MMTYGDLTEQHQEHLALYLQYRETALSLKTRRELLAALCSSRGALNFSGTPDLIGDKEKIVAALLSSEELHLVLQGVEIEKLNSRLLHFLRLSEENGGDVSLIEPEEEQNAVVEEGKSLLWERHDIACQLEGIRWWLQQQAELKAAVEPALTEYRQTLSRLDIFWREHIHHFLPFNAYRRWYRDVYSQAQEFWWWHLLSDCDVAAVYRVADGKEEPFPHLQSCSSCQNLLRELTETKSLLRNAQDMPLFHPQPEDLVRLYYGEVGGQEEEALEWHLRLCEQCRWELDAIQRGEGNEEQISEELEVKERERGKAQSPVVCTFPLPTEAALAVAARRGKRGVQGLPGQLIYQDDEIEVWVNEEESRVILRVYGDDLQGLGVITALEYDTFELQAVTEIAQRPTIAEFDLGGVQELQGKRLLLSLQYNTREIELPRLDLIKEEASEV